MTLAARLTAMPSSVQSHVKDVSESARVAARETGIILCRFVGVLFFGLLVSLIGGAFVAAAFFPLRWLYPHLSTDTAISISVMVMILPVSALIWFCIVFSVEYEQRRKHRE